MGSLWNLRIVETPMDLEELKKNWNELAGKTL
jgi:hypothetical protein